MIRLFIALELSKNQKKEVGGFQETAKKHLSNVRWVKPDNIHLTLKFLGETSEEKVEVIKEAIDNASAGVKPFLTRFAGSGVFPSEQKARVLWIGVDEGKDRVCDLAEKVEEEMAGLGYKKEKRSFNPHLTIGRIRSAPPSNAIRNFLTEGKNFVSSEAMTNKVVLFESELSRSGAIYRPLYESKLL